MVLLRPQDRQGDHTLGADLIESRLRKQGRHFGIRRETLRESGRWQRDRVRSQPGGANVEIRELVPVKVEIANIDPIRARRDVAQRPVGARGRLKFPK